MPYGVKHKQHRRVNQSNGGPTVFAIGLTPVVRYKSPSVQKNPSSVFKGNAVLLQAQYSFGSIPFELQRASLLLHFVVTSRIGFSIDFSTIAPRPR